MNGACAFCGAPDAAPLAGPLRLCGDCLEQLLSASAREARYVWFQGAVRRSLFAREIRETPSPGPVKGPPMAFPPRDAHLPPVIFPPSLP